MNEIAIRKENIDWLKVINLVLNKQDWGKTYLMYSCSSMTISCMMKEFNFEDQEATFKINIEYVHNDTKYTDIGTVRYATQNFTVDNFKMHLNKYLINSMNYIISSMTKNNGNNLYGHLHHYSWDITAEQIIKAGLKDDYEKIMNIDNKDLRELCFNELKNETAEILNEEYDEKVEEYCENNKVVIDGLNSILTDIEREE